VHRLQSGLLQEQESALAESRMSLLSRTTALVRKAEGVYKANYSENSSKFSFFKVFKIKGN
jgi:hypothetical protein